jgi:lactoylglutathione lyase
MTAVAGAKPQDWYERTGLILFTQNYEECLAFYRDTLGLEQIFQKESLTTLRFGTGYLMIETDGVAQPAEKSFAQNPVTIRFNVADVEKTAEMLRRKGVEVTVHYWNWGVTGLMIDPDGNRVELKDHFDGYHARA